VCNIPLAIGRVVCLPRFSARVEAMDGTKKCNNQVTKATSKKRVRAHA